MKALCFQPEGLSPDQIVFPATAGLNNYPVGPLVDERHSAILKREGVFLNINGVHPNLILVRAILAAAAVCKGCNIPEPRHMRSKLVDSLAERFEAELLSQCYPSPSAIGVKSSAPNWPASRNWRGTS